MSNDDYALAMEVLLEKEFDSIPSVGAYNDATSYGHWELSGNGKLEQWAWGWIQGTGANGATASHNFPKLFSTLPEFFAVSIIGYKQAVPTAINDSLSAPTNTWPSGEVSSVSAYIAGMYNGTALPAGNYILWSMHAIGRGAV